jgi:hypothetical protein
MPGSAQSWDQSQDPRENTMDLPRIDLAGLADYFRGAAPPPRPAGSAQSPPGKSEPAAMAAADESTTGRPPEPAVSRAGGTATAADPAVAGAVRVRPPAEAAEVSGPPVFAPTSRPAAGSLADLRYRLARLPAGHPSSPYEDGGQARPLPTRLRQLELGLPAPGREAGDGATSRAEVGDSAHQASVLAEVAADLNLPPEPEQARPEREASEADRRPAADEPPHPDLLAGAGLLPGADLPPSAGLPASLDPGEPSGGHGDNGRLAERRRDPQWQDPYAAEPDRNGHASPESTTDFAGEPVFGPWPGEGAGLTHPARNGGRNGNGSGRADVRPQTHRPDHGPLEPDWQDRDWHDRDRHDRDRHDRDRQEGDRHDRDRHDRDRHDLDRHDRDRPDAGPPPPPDRELHYRELHYPRQEQELHHPRPEREVRHPRPDRARHDTWPTRDRSDLHQGPPGPDRLDRRVPEPQHRDTVQHGTLQPHTPDAGPDVDGLAELVEQTLARCQAAEGRNMFGTYGSSGLTPAIRRLAAQLPAGGLAPGSEEDSLKPADRFAAKLSRLIARNTTRSPADLAETISDAVRYAFAFEAADYTEGTWLVHRKLKAQGFELDARRNRWQSPEHKGIFTRWRDPAHGIAFEVQFHTMASWAVAKRTHDSYSRITDPATPPAERAQLRARQVAAAASAKPPPGCMEIEDFRGEPR